ncbi:hypothetical protein ACFL51_01675 [Myxococcota bacterium]
MEALHFYLSEFLSEGPVSRDPFGGGNQPPPKLACFTRREPDHPARKDVCIVITIAVITPRLNRRIEEAAIDMGSSNSYPSLENHGDERQPIIISTKEAYMPRWKNADLLAALEPALEQLKGTIDKEVEALVEARLAPVMEALQNATGAVPKKRGRPPKKAAKKRGRPPKKKAAKKRGRPPKKVAKKRGRPPKKAAKKRGRPPKKKAAPKKKTATRVKTADVMAAVRKSLAKQKKAVGIGVIEKDTGYNQGQIRRALAELITDKAVTKKGVKRNTVYALKGGKPPKKPAKPKKKAAKRKTTK